MPARLAASTPHGDRKARRALECLVQDDAAGLASQLGCSRVDGVRRAQACLRDALETGAGLEPALELARLRIDASLAPGDPDRRGAMLTLLLARGVARGHLPMPFDPTAWDLLDPQS